MTRTLTLSALILSLAACGSANSDYASVLPDDRLLVDMPADFGGQARTALGDRAEYWQMTADVTTDVNTFIGEVLGGVEEITSFEPTWTDNRSRALWGPWEDGDTNGRLWVEQQASGDYVWAVEAKLTSEGEDAWTAVIAGEVDAGSDEITSSGRFALDFAAFSRFDPDQDTKGEFYVDYSVDGEVVDAEAAFVDYQEGTDPGGDAVYVYGQDGTGAGMMDLAVLADAEGTPSADPELHIVRTRWNADGEGRADVYMTEGDLGPLVYQATECWGTDASVTYYEDNYEFTRNGDESACVFAEPDFNEDEESVAR